MKRRDFLSKAAIIAGSAAVASNLPAAAAAIEAEAASIINQQTKTGDMLYRPLGKTGKRVSVFGLGGFHLGKIQDEQECIRLIRGAIDRGLTFMDNCWDYHKGVSEIRMGKALKDGYREKAFLMTKIDGRDRKTAAQQIDESLMRLQSDRVDLMQFHEIIRLEDPDRIFAPGGAAEAVTEAKRAGKIRFVGFTGHKDPSVHMRMLEIAAANNFKFDTVQLPLNVMDAHFRSFEKLVLPKLVKDGIGVLGMKSLGDPFILDSKTATAMECFHYSLSLPLSTLVTGIESMERLDQAFEAVRTFKPLTKAQVSALLARTETAAKTGKYERFKTDVRFDGTAKNPEWLGGMEK